MRRERACVLQNTGSPSPHGEHTAEHRLSLRMANTLIEHRLSLHTSFTPSTPLSLSFPSYSLSFLIFPFYLCPSPLRPLSLPLSLSLSPSLSFSLSLSLSLLLRFSPFFWCPPPLRPLSLPPPLSLSPSLSLPLSLPELFNS